MSTDGRDPRQVQLLQSGHKLNVAQAQIQQTTRAALETEATGFQVLSELARQREGIDRFTQQLNEANDNTSMSRWYLTQMHQRHMVKRGALIFMVLLLIAVIVVIVYFLIIKKD
eukprot:TRINITY_DN7503_c1_g1_i1.p1 TRINITY_DN7503_c1_g1~~TRINITY_DN7503_c1_g1_i1.p1  ORF type:complete len:128 (+),score=17.93 TRINITY_DN7503_c1_g1_i1:45-386(+)